MTISIPSTEAVHAPPCLSRSWLAEQLYDLVLGLDLIAHASSMNRRFVDYAGLLRALHNAVHVLADKVVASASRPGSLEIGYADLLRTHAADAMHEAQSGHGGRLYCSRAYTHLVGHIFSLISDLEQSE